MTGKKEINLEEKLRKLIGEKKTPEKKVEEKNHDKIKVDPVKKPEEKKKSESTTTKEVKEILPEKRLPIIESAIVSKTDLQNTIENKEPLKNETLEQAISNAPIIATEKQEAGPESISYSITGKSNSAGNYQTGNSANTSGSKYNPGISNTHRNLNRDQDQNNSPNLMSSRLYNPFDNSKRDSFAYANDYSPDGNAGENDSTRMYEETKQKFYEASHKDIHDKKSNKNI